MKYDSMWVEENGNCYDCEGSLANYGVRSKARWGNGISNGMIFVKNGISEFFISEEDLKNEAENWGLFFKNKEKFQNFLEHVEKDSKKMKEEIQKILAKDLSKLSNKELFQAYLDYIKAVAAIFCSYVVSQPHRIKKLENELKKAIEAKNWDEEVFVKLASSRKRIIFKEHDIFEKNFYEILKSGIDKELFQGELYHEEEYADSERDKLLAQLDDKTKEIAEILSILGHERMKMRFVWMPAMYYYELLLVELKRRYNIDEKTLKLYDSLELEDLILVGVKLDEKVLEKRRKGFLKVLKEEKFQTYDGEEAEKMLNLLIEREKAKQMNGMVANKGHVVGRAVIFSYKKPGEHSEKIKNMKEGSVVISEMTRPNLVPALSKAVAIVTDEGGITCHAAIVAREFNLPTVVGTKIATHSISDGDWVEVDAVNGIVRVLEK